MKTSQNQAENGQSTKNEKPTTASDTVSEFADNPVADVQHDPRTFPTIRPNNVIALQRLIGNRAVQRVIKTQQPQGKGSPQQHQPISTSSMSPLQHILIQRAMMTLEDWNKTYHAEGVVFTPYLQSIEDDLKKYHANAAPTDDTTRRNKVESLFGLRSKTGQRFSLPDEEYKKIPSSWYLGDIGKESETLLEGMTGGADKTAKLQYAQNEHKADRTFLKTILNEGFAQNGDLRLKNSCEWILKKRAKFYVLTPTGDTIERAKAASEDTAYFPNPSTGTGHIMDDTEQTYNKDDISDNANIKFAGKSDLGYNLQGLIAVYRPREQGRANIEETLRHEVQHDADRSWDTKKKLTFGTPAHTFERYKTEYRAYNYEGGQFDKLSHTKKENHSQDGSDNYEWTEKQWGVFQHIYKLYSYTSDAWKTNPPNVDGTKSFREAVVAYVNPDDKGFNKINSIRIDDFYNALDKVPLATEDPENSAVKETIKAAKALTITEAEVVLKQSPEMLSKMHAHLKGEAFDQVKWVIAPTMPEPVK